MILDNTRTIPARQLELDTPRGRLAAQHWPADGPRILCLHGWLDNAASFAPMAPYLAEFDLVTLDFAGHGHSYHHDARDHYYFTDYLWDIDAALDALGWSECHLVGHSMGAAVGALYACAAPERVRSLVCLDALGPISAPAGRTAERLKKSLHSVRAGPRQNKPYGSIEAMIRARQANVPLSDHAARLLCERSSMAVDTHLEWTTDPALHWISPSWMAEEQVIDCLAGIEAPVLSLTATPLAPFNQAHMQARGAALQQGQLELVEGTHHFHMEQPRQTAERIRNFIAGVPATTKP